MNTQENNFSNLEVALQQYGEQLISLYRQRLSRYNVDASGTLGNTLNFIISNEEGTYELALNIQDYWIYVEEGRRPGKFPPINNIKQWIRIKPVLPRGFAGKLPTTEQLAYLIGRKIAEKGTRGRYIYKDTIEELGSFEAFEEAITKDLNAQVDNVFIDFKK